MRESRQKFGGWAWLVSAEVESRVSLTLVSELAALPAPLAHDVCTLTVHTVCT